MTGGDADHKRALAVLVLAAGKGTRLGGGDDLPPKVLLDCLGIPLIEHVRRALAPLGAAETVVVTGYQAEVVDAWLEDAWSDARRVLQEPQNGTGHATRIALDALPDFDGDVLVIYGDVPQLLTDDLRHLLDAHRDREAAATVLTGVVPEPGLLGRIVRDANGAFARIVEARDATPDELALTEFNTGLYVFDAAALRPALAGLTTDNDQGEEYLTDALTSIAGTGGRIEAVCSADPRSLLGVNDWADVAAAVATLRRRICDEHMRRGVRITDPDTTVIEADVEIAPDAHVYPFTHIGIGCRIGAGAKVGPFARLRGGTVLEPGAEIGNFVEVKGSTVGAGAKAKHLTYLGDAQVGAKANVGCGVVTANYDGKRKHQTVIGPEASIGSGTILVAPVEVGRGGTTGANAVILPKDGVPEGATVVGVPARVLPAKEQAEDGDSPAKEGSG
ncbi:MAG: NTP transferase domain-containing protein [Planctomycetota bacterium]|nr:NTP transferase domain-containing protein [Planctomycetota bacterium]